MKIFNHIFICSKSLNLGNIVKYFSNFINGLKHLIITIFLLAVVNNLYSVSNIDSLNIKLLQVKSDTGKIITCVSLLHSGELAETEKDTIYENLIKLADNLYNEYLLDSTKENLVNYFTNVYLNVSDYYFYDKNDYKRAYKIYKKQIEIYKKLNNKKELAKVYNRIGTLYKFKSEFEKALKYYQLYLDLSKQINNKKGEAYAHIGIANVFINWGKHNDAINNYNLCMRICEQIHDTVGLSASVTGLGNVYFQINNIPKALKNHKEAYRLYSKINDKEGIALSLLNIGEIYTKTKEYDKALDVYNKALKISIDINAEIRIALIYSLIADVYFAVNDYEKAIKYYNLSLPFAQKTDYKKVIVSDYKGLAYSFKQIGNFSKAFNFLSNYNNLNDSIFNEEKHKQLAEINTKYKTVQKEKLIKQQKFEIEKDKILNEKRTYQLNFILILFFLVIVVMFFIIRGYRQKRKANELLAKQNKEISEQRDKIQKQKEVVDEIHREISESINYATRLQAAILPEQELLNKYLTEHFVLFKPKDKVSGDFYWWTHIDGYTIITAADCTGHGVPGAFMSMLGVSFLREIVEKEYITNTALILKKLRKEIIKALKQKGLTGEQKDGMDMSIISINHNTNVVQFSGANNPLYIITNEKRSLTGFENLLGLEGFFEIKPDKMPIAIYEKMDNFTTHEIQLQKGDQLYMFSDGFADQFGGEKSKKFKYKPFKRLLLANANKSMQEQKELLNLAFEEWKRNEEQVDDVVVLGVKL